VKYFEYFVTGFRVLSYRVKQSRCSLPSLGRPPTEIVPPTAALRGLSPPLHIRFYGLFRLSAGVAFPAARHVPRRKLALVEIADLIFLGCGLPGNSFREGTERRRKRFSSVTSPPDSQFPSTTVPRFHPFCCFERIGLSRATPLDLL